ncbi:MAG: prepilin peptidase [Alphaproteobacteria bacterium]
MVEDLTNWWQAADIRHGLLIAGGGLAIWAAASDVRRFLIPNRAVILLLLSGIFFVAVGGGPDGQFAGVGYHALGFAGVLAVGFAAYLLNFFGAGDAKLLAALSIWMGPPGAVMLIVHTVLLGGVLAIGWSFSRPLRTALMVAGLPVDPEPPAEIPYGVAIAGAGLIGFADLWPSVI